jgi:hypothetical protein
MTTTTAETALFAAAAALLIGCGAERLPGPARASASPGETRDAGLGPAVPASELLGLRETARHEAAGELVGIVLILRPGDREAEVSWVLAYADPARKGQVLDSLTPAEILRFQREIRGSARSIDPAERDPALAALVKAGELDVQPLVARALRTEGSEASLVALAAVASRLGPLLPAAALRTALARARTARALLAITEALGSSLDAEALRILASRGSAAGPALERAITRMRGQDLPAGQELDSPPAASVPTAAAIELAHRRAAEIIGDDAARERAAARRLSSWLSTRSLDAADAAAALGVLRTPSATAALALALGEAEGELLAAVSAALADALGVGPARVPESSRELRALWFPILATLVGPERQPPETDSNH